MGNGHVGRPIMNRHTDRHTHTTENIISLHLSRGVGGHHLCFLAYPRKKTNLKSKQGNEHTVAD